MRINRIVELISKNGNVKRYHTDRVIHHETIAHHSWGVAMFCIALSKDKPSLNLLKAALYHDLAEHVTGDVPAPAKWENQCLKDELESIELDFNDEHDTDPELIPEEIFILKVADMLQLMTYVQGEWKMGNRTLDHIFENGFKYLTNFDDLPLLAVNILETMRYERNTK